MPRALAAPVVLLSVLLLAIGCERGDGPKPEDDVRPAHRDGKPASRQPKTPRGRELAQKPAAEESEAEQGPPANNPLIRGLDGMLGKTLTEQTQKDVRSALRDADDQLSRIRAENQAALREVNRQQRLAGEDVPHIVLFLSRELGPTSLGCYGASTTLTPRVDKLAAEGVRFANFGAPDGGFVGVCWSLMTGLQRPHAPSAHPFLLQVESFSLARVLWYAGYTTAIIGDCSMDGAIPPGETGRHEFEEWFGYRDPVSAANPWPEYLWNKGASLRVLANADRNHGLLGSDILRQEALAYLDRHGRGRPFFLLALWPAAKEQVSESGHSTGGPAPAAAIARADRDLGAVVDRLRSLRIERNTVLFVVGGAGPEPAPKPAAVSPPEVAPKLSLIVWAPGRFPCPRLIERRCSPSDILPTLGELARARRRPRNAEGTSLVPLLRQPDPQTR